METSNLFNKTSALVGIIGFDLGTTNSVATSYDSEGMPTVLMTDSGETTPSCVMFNDDGSYTIGRAAYQEKHKPNVVCSFKKYMGTGKKISVQRGSEMLQLTAKEISTIFVSEMMKQVTNHNPQFRGIDQVIVSVPAYFDVNQVNDTRQVFLDLGYKVPKVQQEPTSAALVFQSIKRITQPVLVFDLGGGTFDAVLMRSELGFPEESVNFYKERGLELPPIKNILEIIDISGDNFLGGDDIDEISAELFEEKYKTGISKRELIVAAELVKKTRAPQMVDDCEFSYDFVVQGTNKVLDKCFAIVDRMLNRAGIQNVHCVLCGGSTKSQIIRDRISKRFNFSMEIDPDLAVAIGDAMTFKGLSDMPIISRMAKHLGIIVDNKFTPLVKKGDVIPARKIFQAQNITPFKEAVDIDIFQTEDLFGSLTKVHTLKLEDLGGFNKDGFALIKVEAVVTMDSIITMSAKNNGKQVSATLDVVDVPAEISENKWVRRLRSAIEKNNLNHLLPLLEEFRDTEDMSIAREIDKQIRECRDGSK